MGKVKETEKKVKETEQQYIARKDRNSRHREVALTCAVQISQIRQNVKEHAEEITGWANTFYNWLEGDGQKSDAPKLESKED